MPRKHLTRLLSTTRVNRPAMGPRDIFWWGRSARRALELLWLDVDQCTCVPEVLLVSRVAFG